MTLKAIFGVVYYPKGNPFSDERILMLYEHTGLFGALLPGGRLNATENAEFEYGNNPMRNIEILESALKRETKEELGESVELTPDSDRLYIRDDSITSHKGDVMKGKIYLMRAHASPQDPLELINKSKMPIAYLNANQLESETKSDTFKSILSEPGVRQSLGLPPISNVL